MTYLTAPLGYYMPLGTDRFLGGPTVIRQQLLYILEIDWDNDGVFDGGNDAFWLMPGGWEYDGGRERFIRSTFDGFERIPPARCVIQLNNDDGRYTPRNTSSPLYPYLLTNEPRLARFAVMNQDDGLVYEIINGMMVTFMPIDDTRGRSRLRVEIKDGMKTLIGEDINIDVQSGIRTDEAIGLVLDDIGWQWGRDLEVGVDTIPYWWAFDRSPYTTIMDLAEAELAIFFIAPNGDATMLTRFYSDPDPIVLSGADISPEIGISQPSETFRDKVIIRVHPLVLRSTSILWTLDDVPVFIEAGQTKEFWPEFNYENRKVAVIDPITPVKGVGNDFVANSLSNGRGSDLSNNFTLEYVPFGNRGLLRVTNNGADAHIIKIDMRGDALDSSYSTGVRTGTGKNAIEIDLPLQQNTSSGQESADYLHELLADPTKYYLTISMEGLPEIQFAKLFRWVDLTIASKSISDLFRISKISHRPGGKRRVVRTTWWLEPTLNLSVTELTQLDFQLPAKFGEP